MLLRSPSLRDDTGSATVIAVAMVAVLLFVTAACAYLGSAVVARHRAQSAADLAALAAASKMPYGSDSACARALLVANEMRVSEFACRAEGLDAIVKVGMPTAFGAVARAAARAGPAVR